jgi:hypothetical protein
MNWSRFFIAFVVIYVVGGLLNFLMHGVLLMESYEAIQSVWRPDMDRLMWIQWVTPLFLIFFFLYIFARGYEGKGIMEGVRFGLIIWAFVSIPMTYGQYMLYPLPYSLVWKWLAADLVSFVVFGILAAAIYKPLETKKTT